MAQQKDKKTFAEKTEKIIDPVSVGTIHFLQQINGFLPKFIQQKMMNATAKKAPLMGFVVEPYSSFLCYEITDIQAAQHLLPEHFKLIKTSIFANDTAKYYAILGSFRAHTSAFWGARTEFYIIAEDKRTGLLSWVIIDYDTNTISHDQKHGLTAPNSVSIMTVNHRGQLYVDVRNKTMNRNLNYSFSVENQLMKKLDQRLWLEGNLSVGYGKQLSNDGAVFALRFEPNEVERALFIKPNEVSNLTCNWYSSILAKRPSVVACFPYAQHFISDTPGAQTVIRNKKELVSSIEYLDFSSIKPLSVKSLKIMFIVGPLISTTIIIGLLLLYILK